MRLLASLIVLLSLGVLNGIAAQDDPFPWLGDDEPIRMILIELKPQVDLLREQLEEGLEQIDQLPASFERARGILRSRDKELRLAWIEISGADYVTPFPRLDFHRLTQAFREAALEAQEIERSQGLRHQEDQVREYFSDYVTPLVIELSQKIRERYERDRKLFSDRYQSAVFPVSKSLLQESASFDRDNPDFFVEMSRYENLGDNEMLLDQMMSLASRLKPTALVLALRDLEQDSVGRNAINGYWNWQRKVLNDEVRMFLESLFYYVRQGIFSEDDAENIVKEFFDTDIEKRVALTELIKIQDSDAYIPNEVSMLSYLKAN